MTVVDLNKLLNIPQAAKRCEYSEAQLRNRSMTDGSRRPGWPGPSTSTRMTSTPS